MFCLYDDNGNQTQRNNDDVSWTSYNYVSSVEEGNNTHAFFYGGSRQRWKQTFSTPTETETTIFIGGIMEKRSINGVDYYNHYVYANGKPVAIKIRATDGTIVNRYLHLDHQGSVAEISRSNETIKVSESFSAFGERRDPTDWAGPGVNSGQGAHRRDHGTRLHLPQQPAGQRTDPHERPGHGCRTGRVIIVFHYIWISRGDRSLPRHDGIACTPSTAFILLKCAALD